ncbi:hypothetical protein BC830DRAFT_1095987 [Chytriomyces sp. MP71]|nr:hypothetical protein BC830DRAFT_1095987 [Chytriomyces sp. MP71]
MTRVVVIPATSQSGLACVHSLLSNPGPVTAIRLVSRRAQADAEKALTFSPPASVTLEVLGGVDASSDPAILQKVFEGFDSALLVTPHDYSAGISQDAAMTENMIHAAAAAGIKHATLVGSWTVNEPVALSGLAARFVGPEAVLQNSGMFWTILRGGFFSQNFKVHAGKIKASQELVVTSGIFSPVDVDDIGRCAAATFREGSAKHGGKIYEMNGPEELSIEEVFRVIGDVTGRVISVKVVPSSALPLQGFMKQAFEFYEKPGQKAPYTQDVGDLIGKEWTSFRSFVERNKSAFM